MSNITYGIRRLILLNTASYALGDFPLDRPLSISAPNNRGKSTAINALQFPFLSSMTDMSFPRSNEDTRRYYFPYDNSYVISEIVTETGSYVVGAVGKGQASGYEYQLFAYKAQFNLDDFLIEHSESGKVEKEIRTFKKLSVHLSQQDIWVKPLTPKQMRDALMGKTITLSNDEKFTIGVFRLISMTDDNYRLFIRVFKNLLHMNNVNLEEMKHLLIDILLPGQGNTSVDFMARYRILNEEVDQANGKVSTANAIVEDVAKLADAVKLRDTSYGVLRTLFPRITNSYEIEYEKRREKIENIRKSIQSIEPEIINLNSSRDPLQTSIEDLAVRNGELSKQLDSIRQGDVKYALYPEKEKLEEQIVHLNEELERLVGELQRTHPEDIGGLKTDLHEAETQLKEIKARISATNNNLLFLLSEHFGEPQIQTIAKLFNQNLLLSLPLDENGVSVTDQESLFSWLQSALRCCINGVYDDGRIRVNLNEIPIIDVQDYFDYDANKAKQDRLEKRADRLQRDIDVAIDYKKMELRKKELSRKIDEEKHNLMAYIKYLSMKSTEQDLQKEFDKISAQLISAKEELGGINEKILSASRKKQELEANISSSESALRQLEEKYRKVSPISSAEPIGKEPNHQLPTALEDMIDKYLLALESRNKSNEQIETRLSFIENKGGLRFTSGQDQENTIRELIEAVQNIDGLEKLRNESQKAVSQEIGALLKGLRERFITFEHEIKRFNRSMNAKKISNLKSIQFIIDNDNDIYSTINTLVDQNDLFSHPDKVHQAVRNLDKKITEKGVKLSLDNLFNLGVFVELENNEITKSFKDANIQSTGTGLTVKVILNVMLLNKLLFYKKGQIINIPIYIDEAGQIDPSNQQTLIDQCMKSGFIPVFASVEAQACADYWIGLQERDGRIYVDQSDWFRMDKIDAETKEPTDA